MQNESQSELYLKLVELAFTHFTKATATVLAIETLSLLSYVDFDSSTVVRVNTVDEVASTANRLLQEGPVLLLPPWGRIEGRRSDWRDQYEEVLTSCAPSEPSAMLAAVIPAQSLTSTLSTKFRQALELHWQTALVMYTRDIVPGIHGNFEIATIFLRARNADSQLPLRIFQHARDDDESTVLDDFNRLLKRNGGRGELGYVLRDIPTPEAGLAFTRHDPTFKARQAALSDFAVAATFDDIFETVFRAFNIARERELICEAEDAHAIRVVSGRDLRRDGTIGPPDERTLWAQVPAERCVRAGDVLLQGISHRSNRSGPAVVHTTEADLPFITSDHVLVLRPRLGVPPAHLALIVQYLRSPLAHQILTASGNGGVHVSIQALREMPMPQPDEDLTAALEDVARAVSSFESWRTEAEAVLRSAFPANEDFKAGRMRLVDHGRKSRLRVEAAANLDDYGYIVRTRFPYPVAYRWRTVEAAKSAGVSGDALETVLHTAEVLLCYAAHLVLVLARDARIELGYAARLRTIFGRGKGPGFGDWAAILEELRDNKAFRTLPDAHPLRDLQSMLGSQAARVARRRLNNVRNDESHLRKVDAIDLPAVFESAHADLMTLLDAAKFLSDMTLIHVTRVHWDSIHRRTEVAYRELMGDHPVAPTRTLDYDDPGIEVDSLYIIDTSHRLHLLRPFLIGRICTVCRNWSTFHCDSVKGQQVTLKSLEHGHPADDHTLAATLRQVGLT